MVFRLRRYILFLNLILLNLKSLILLFQKVGINFFCYFLVEKNTICGSAFLLRINLTSTSVFTTIAGILGLAVSTNGEDNIAKFDHPLGIHIEPNGVIYIADKNNHVIRKLTPQ